MWSLLTGDQGFLNSYYAGFANAHVFEPNLSPEVLNSRPVPEMERLSTLYNADVGLYMLANKVLLHKYGEGFLLFPFLILIMSIISMAMLSDLLIHH